MEKIKMSSRMAKRLLASKPCEIYVEKASSHFTTSAGIRDAGVVYVPKEQILVPLEDITSISFEDRFGSKSEMEVEW